MGLLRRFPMKKPPIRQCDSETKFKISSFFERITMYIEATWPRATGGVGVASMDVHSIWPIPGKLEIVYV